MSILLFSICRSILIHRNIMTSWIFSLFSPRVGKRSRPKSWQRQSVKDDEPSCELWDYVLDMDWEQVIRHAREYPNDAKYYDGHYHESVLYLACQHNPPKLAIQAILQAYPEAVLMVSRAHHDIALHIATRYQLHSDIISELVQRYPKTAVKQTRFGRTPLMALWEFRNNDDKPLEDDTEFWNKVFILLNAVARHREELLCNNQTLITNTNCKQCRNEMNLTDSGLDKDKPKISSILKLNPVLYVHAAVSLGALNCPIGVLEYALERFPNQVYVEDHIGLLPLHIAVGPTTWNGSTRRKYRPREKAFITMLLVANPNAARQKVKFEQKVVEEKLIINNDLELKDIYQYPLFVALSNRHLWNGGIKELFQAAPEVLLKEDPITNLFPFQLAATPIGDTTVDLDTVYSLLRSQPAVMASFDFEKDCKSNNEKINYNTAKKNWRFYNYFEDVGKQDVAFFNVSQSIFKGTITSICIGVAAGILFVNI